MQEFSYFHTFNVKAKERWLNKSILDALSTEYKSRSKEYFINAIKSGSILLNNKKTNINHILNHHDLISHTIHIHEPLSIEIPIISVSDDLLVVNKPGGIACHPTSNYNYFTVTKILEKKYGKLSCINRLDVPTSGVLLLSRNVNNELFEMMKKRFVKKVYLAKVKGDFNDQNVSKKIKNVPGKNNIIDDSGRECYTEFKKVFYNDGYSLVKCFPFTGRTHQIRVHLASINYPIINDKLYNEEYYNKEENNHKEEENNIKEEHNYKKENHNKEEKNNNKEEHNNKEENQYKEEKNNNKEEHNNKEENHNKENNNKKNSKYIDDKENCNDQEIPNKFLKKLNSCNGKINTPENEIDDIFENKINLSVEARNFILNTCEQRNNKPFKNINQFICLHARKYEIDGRVFEAELPDWAKW